MTVYLSASDAGMDYQLDRIFFENWYGYWHDALLHDGGISLLQYLAVRYFPAQDFLFLAQAQNGMTRSCLCEH